MSLVARKMSQFNKTLYRDIFLAPRLLPHKKAITSALYQRTHVKLSIHNCLKNVPCLCAGCPTEYGENITSSQAKPIQAISSESNSLKLVGRLLGHPLMNWTLAWPGLTWTGQNGTFVLVSTGGLAQSDVSPCTRHQMLCLFMHTEE